MTAPLISSQRHLDHNKVLSKACAFKVFVVRTLEISLRGRVEPTWRGPSRKTLRVQAAMTPAAFERLLINNLTDSDWYYVDSGEIVVELLGAERVVA